MSPSFVSTRYLSTSLLYPMMQAQSALASATVEASTGQYADLGLQLGDRSGYELSLRNQTDLLQSLTAANSITTTNLDTARSALDSIRSSAQSTLQSLAAWTPGTSGATLQTLGSGALQTLIAGANASAGGTFVFGGINSAVPPLADFYSSPAAPAKAALDAAFQTTFGFAPTSPAAANISGSAMQTFLDGPFAAAFQGANWAANWSSASSSNTSSEIAPGQIATTSTNANQSGFPHLAEAYAMLSEFGGTALSGAAIQAVATTATGLVTQGVASMTATEAEVGGARSRIDDANSAMSSQLTILQTQLGKLDNVDPAETAVRVNALTTQIQTSYALTSRLHQLSLAQYLPNA